MAIKCGYYNSLNGDRKYNAEEMSQYFRGIISRGVLQNFNGKFLVTATEGMTVKVGTGRAYFSDGKYIENTTDYMIDLNPSDVVLNRIDRIVLRNDKNEGARAATIVYKVGTPSSDPIAPTVENTEYVEELSLCTIAINKLTETITQAEITNTIPDTAVCGYCEGIINDVDTHDLYAQYEAAYSKFYTDSEAKFDGLENEINTWYSGIKGDISAQLPLKQYRNTVTTTADEQKVIPIGISDYEPLTDVLEVFINGLRLTDAEYTADASNVTLTAGLDSGQPVEMVVNKYIVNGDDPATIAGQITALQNAVKSLQDNALNFNDIYPVGSFYISTNATDPKTLFGGTWEQIKDTFLLAAGDTYTAGSTGGEAEHILIIDEIPSHSGHLQKNNGHVTIGNTNRYLGRSTLQDYAYGPRGWNDDGGGEMYPAGQSVGGGQPHNNMPPYLTVYVWKRTA